MILVRQGIRSDEVAKIIAEQLEENPLDLEYDRQL